MKLSEEQIANFLSENEGWSREEKELVKRYACVDFKAAMAFAVRVADKAEQLRHHPSILIDYNKVTLRLTTHDEGGLTELDLRAASELDALF